jgi:hypothetical protein
MSLATYTLLHVVISLVGIGTGLVVLFGMLNSKKLNGWTGTFLATTALTSITGYGFPFEKLLPSHIIGAISLVLLAFSIFALYGRHLKSAWRSIYVVGALLALYLNIFVAIIQSFLKIPTLKALAPTQKEPPFQITQLLVLVLFVLLITFAIRRFHPQSARALQAAAH